MTRAPAPGWPFWRGMFVALAIMASMLFIVLAMMGAFS